MAFDFDFYERCIVTLENAFQKMQLNDETIDHDIYRSACIKEFEIILEQSGKLLRKVLKNYEAQPKVLDTMAFKPILRLAVNRGLIGEEAIERWMQYRDVRNRTAHDYGVNFAEETIAVLPTFLEDASALLNSMRQSVEQNN